MTQQTYKAEIAVTSQMIADQIIAAIEGGSNYWYRNLELAHSDHIPEKRPWYSDPKVYESTFIIKIDAPEDDAETELKTYQLTPDTINQGLAFLAKQYPTVIKDIVMEEGDADTADLFLQACLFQEIIYG